MRRLLVVLVCLCCSTAARASITESFPGTKDVLNWLKDGDTCSSAYLAALAQCKLETIELQRKLVYHEPQRQHEREILNRGIQIGFVLSTLMSIGLAWVAFNARQQRRAAYLKWVKLEASLRAQLIGVHRQAFDFAVKLQAATSHAATGKLLDQRAGAQSLQLHSPVETASNKADAACTSPHPHSAASTPPAPVSESSVPNLALLVAEASPAKDAGARAIDQLLSASAAKVPSDVKSPNGYNEPTPGHPAGPMSQHQPNSASRGTGPLSSPAGRYSPQTSPNPVAPRGTNERLVPGGFVAVPPGATSNAAGSAASPPAGYFARGPVPGSAQRAGPGAVPAQWTPQQQQQQHLQQQQALSCPPMAGAGSPYGARCPAPGAAPHSAGALGAAAPGMPAGHLRPAQQGMMQQGPTPAPAGPGGWVNTSRGSGTPLPFGSMGMQQQPFASPMLPSSPMMHGLCTPGTASTAQTGGSLTRVQSVHSTAGSCGGPAPPLSSTPGSTTPMSASSATSNSGASRSPARTLQLQSKSEQLIERLGNLAEHTAERARLSKEALEKARAEQQHQQAGQLGASPAGSCADIRRSPV